VGVCFYLLSVCLDAVGLAERCAGELVGEDDFSSGGEEDSDDRAEELELDFVILCSLEV